MMPDEAPPGFASTVHTGPMMPVTIWKAPGEYVLPNVLVAMMIILLFTWRWVVITALVHLILAAFWYYDRFLLPDVGESFTLRRFLGVE